MSEHTHNPIVTNQCFFLSFKSQSLQYCILFTTCFALLLKDIPVNICIVLKMTDQNKLRINRFIDLEA